MRRGEVVWFHVQIRVPTGSRGGASLGATGAPEVSVGASRTFDSGKLKLLIVCFTLNINVQEGGNAQKPQTRFIAPQITEL